MQSSYECVHVLRVLLPSWPQKRVYSNRRKPVSMICTLTPINAINLNVAAKNCTDNFIKLVSQSAKNCPSAKLNSCKLKVDKVWKTQFGWLVQILTWETSSLVTMPNESQQFFSQMLLRNGKCYSTEKRPYEFINKSAIIKKIILVYLFPKWKRKMWIWKEQS